MSEIHFCKVCGTSYGGEDHHIIFKSQVKPLDKCPKNHVYLCNIHHRDHRNGVHFNAELDKKFKNEFREWLQSVFVNNYYSPGEIQKILNISVRSTEQLLKALPHRCYLYESEDIIRACMGGKLYAV